MRTMRDVAVYWGKFSYKSTCAISDQTFDAIITTWQFSDQRQPDPTSYASWLPLRLLALLKKKMLPTRCPSCNQIFKSSKAVASHLSHQNSICSHWLEDLLSGRAWEAGPAAPDFGSVNTMLEPEDQDGDWIVDDCDGDLLVDPVEQVSCDGGMPLCVDGAPRFSI
jgi:hypothetical protein